MADRSSIEKKAVRRGPGKTNPSAGLARQKAKRTMITAKLSSDKKKLIIEADLETPRPSGSGKTLIVATTGGNIATGVKIDGKEVKLGLNAYVPKD